MTLTPGQRGDAVAFAEVLDAVPSRCRVRRALADRAFDSDEIRRSLKEKGIEAVIPSNSSRKQEIPYSKRVYRRRNRVERLVCKLKQFRRIATRYEKLATTFQAFIHLAAALIAIR
jgi:transposase